MPSRSSERTLRPATDADIPALSELWAYAFPGERTAAERARGLREGGVYGGVESSWVVEEGGRMAAAFRTYALRSWIRGRCHPVMGLAAVAVAPEFRRRGLGRWACEQALRIGRERGDTLSFLFPFRVSFYGNLDYALVGELHRYRFAPGVLPPFAGWERVSRATGDEAKEAREVYRRVAERSNGLLERTDRMWRFQRGSGLTTLLFRDEAGDARGYAIVRPSRGTRASGSSGRAGSGEWTLRVRELVAEDAAAREALLGWISAQRDQWQEIVYDALPGEDFHRLLPHPQQPVSGRARSLWFHSATILRGPMARVLDVATVLEAMASDASAARPLRIHDPVLAENCGTWDGGTWRVADEERRAAASEAPDLPLAELAERFLAPPGTDFRLLDTF
jgi:predicted acetyltransferase